VITLGAVVVLIVALVGTALGNMGGTGAGRRARLQAGPGVHDTQRAVLRQLDVAVHKVELLRVVQVWRLAAAQAHGQGGDQTARPAAHEPPRAQPTGGGDCGGDLPPCYVLWRESRGQAGAVNPCGCAFGRWQFQQPTWDSVARQLGRFDLVGVPASSVDVGTQDELARALWAGGSGCGNWSAC